jgi:hypothetical protein
MENLEPHRFGKELETLGNHCQGGIGKFSFLARHRIPLTSIHYIAK